MYVYKYFIEKVEAIAEAFADLYANESNANPLLKAIVDKINLLFDEYGKGGE